MHRNGSVDVSRSMRFSLATKTHTGYFSERVSVDKAYEVILQTCLLLLLFAFVFPVILASSQKWESQAHTLDRLKREEHGLSIFLPFQEPWLETRVLFPVWSLHELSLWHGFENNSARRYMLT